MDGRVAIIHSRAMVGLDAVPVSVEVHLAGGLPRVTMVGLPAAAVRESKDRVRSALIASGFGFPDGRLTINLAPAELPKEGGRFDLAIALGVLAVSEHGKDFDNTDAIELLGELSLDGSVRPVLGALPCAAVARDAGRALMLAREGAETAARVRDAELVCVNSLVDAWAYLAGKCHDRVARPPSEPESLPEHDLDLADVRGQAGAKRALTVAAAGAHHVIMVGPPGTGKTMLATRLPTLLPPLNEREALSTAAVYSVVPGAGQERTWSEVPFRAPHHTTSSAGLIGGGSRPQPGEISLAHHGVLFLDELGEFPRFVLEALREPLESGRIVVARANAHVNYPAKFQLVAAMNPCKCGYFGDGSSRCACTPDAVRHYQSRISGPLLDRIDIQLTLSRSPKHRPETAAGHEPPRASPNHPPGTNLEPTPTGPSSAAVQARVGAVRQIQLERQGCYNRDLDERALREFCRLDAIGQDLMDQATERLELSERGVGRIRRVARTIADLEDHGDIAPADLAEAINLRRMGSW